MKPDGRNVPSRVLGMMDEEGNPMTSAPHPLQKLFLRLSEKPDRYDILRMPEKPKES